MMPLNEERDEKKWNGDGVMEELVKRITQAIVDNQDQVSVNKIKDDGTVVLELTVAKEDIGKVIGKQGRNIDAIRYILSAVAAKERKRCVLEIVEEAQPRSSPTPPRSLPVDLHAKSSGKRKGVVKWFDDKRGYGFITMDEGGDIFVHHGNIAGTGVKTLKEHDSVTFEVTQGDKGLKAENIVKL